MTQNLLLSILFKNCFANSQLFLGEASIMTLAILSVQRLLTIIRPEKYKITSFTTSFKIILGIWLYSLCFSVPPFFGFGAYVPETSGVT